MKLEVGKLYQLKESFLFFNIQRQEYVYHRQRDKEYFMYLGYNKDTVTVYRADEYYHQFLTQQGQIVERTGTSDLQEPIFKEAHLAS